jgi:anti-sigma regulatory factor (Ser/Thr protein kinase)
MTDEITLTLPREPEYQTVAHLVLGGLAARLNLTLEHLEDLQLALGAVLARGDDVTGDVTLRLRIDDESLEAIIEPVGSRVLDAVERETDELGLRRVLESTVDDVQVDGRAVRLTKRVATNA